MAHTAVVTGASGYLASELIKQLLEKGYQVKGTVRDISAHKKVGHLMKLAAALPGKLELCSCELLQEGSFDNVIKSSDLVFHTASPFFIESQDPEADLIRPAVQGTLNVLNSVLKSKSSVSRVILTSSVAAVHGEYAAPPKRGTLYSEEDFNETSTIANGQAYHLSKFTAEREAWAFAQRHGLDMVSICPNFIMGPVISDRTDATSIGWMKGLVEGAPAGFAPALADVRDAARAHVRAAETAAASGRYIVSDSRAIAPPAIQRLLQERFPSYDIPDAPPGEWDTEEKIDNSRVQRELGLRLTPAAESIVDMAITLIQMGVAKPHVQMSH